MRAGCSGSLNSPRPSAVLKETQNAEALRLAKFDLGRKAALVSQGTRYLPEDWSRDEEEIAEPDGLLKQFFDRWRGRGLAAFR
ncbi:MAG: hypothetical protein OK454_07200, partial [Thaumarchaeota archaeon]|nr:hypothetical protein [Nitrososphaerota archaeon]